MSFLTPLSNPFATSGRWIALAAFFLSGCGGIGLGTPSLGAAEDEPSAVTSDAGGDDAGHASVDAGGAKSRLQNGDSGAAPAYPGSPLCRAALCDPDGPACIYNPGGADGGGSCTTGTVCSYGGGVTVAACHVGTQPDGGPVPVCFQNFDPGNKQNATCASGSDCAIGYECVNDPQADGGVCKHYCCEPSSCKEVAQEGQPQPFCDIETATGGQPVPVCNLAPGCRPFAQDACPAGQTCTIVSSESGQTACVTVGAAQAGDECADQKCGADLACLGGTCHQLCSPSNICSSGQRCVQPTAYSSLGDFGLCI